eukprot:1196285-Prorocentrum_minimum.AAC.1
MKCARHGRGAQGPSRRTRGGHVTLLCQVPPREGWTHRTTLPGLLIMDHPPARAGSISARAGSISARAGSISAMAESISARAGSISARAGSYVCTSSSGAYSVSATNLHLRLRGEVLQRVRLAALGVERAPHVHHLGPLHSGPLPVQFQRVAAVHAAPRGAHPRAGTAGEGGGGLRGLTTLRRRAGGGGDGEQLVDGHPPGVGAAHLVQQDHQQPHVRGGGVGEQPPEHLRKPVHVQPPAQPQTPSPGEGQPQRPQKTQASPSEGQPQRPKGRKPHPYVACGVVAHRTALARMEGTHD